ncbi:MAG: hypothetical protein M1831_004105 [Alyxoria varia]|nr:MAG: hypothetical protein M1831_004105 [Alyxoria varia]
MDEEYYEDHVTSDYTNPRKRPAQDPPNHDQSQINERPFKKPALPSKSQKPSDHGFGTGTTSVATKDTHQTRRTLPTTRKYTSAEAKAHGAVQPARGGFPSFSMGDDPYYKGESIYRTNWKKSDFRAGDIIHSRTVERCLDPHPAIQTPNFLAKVKTQWEGAYIGKIRPLIVVTLLPSGLLCLPISSHGGNGWVDTQVMCSRDGKPRYDAWRVVKSDEELRVREEPLIAFKELPANRKLEVCRHSSWSPNLGASVEFRPVFLDYQSPIKRNDKCYIRETSLDNLHDWTMELMRAGFRESDPFRLNDRLANFERSKVRFRDSTLWRKQWERSVQKKRVATSRAEISGAMDGGATAYDRATVPSAVGRPASPFAEGAVWESSSDFDQD